MAGGPLRLFLDSVRRLGAGPAEASDGELLGRYAASRDAAAFEALVRRHGPLVWGVCRRVLGHEQDAEDAFQAAFLVLARSARAVRRRDSARSWLYGVTLRVATRARQARARRQANERSAATSMSSTPRPAGDWSDVRPVLDEEVGRLPERYRLPVVLCYLEGRTNDEAARTLGCPRGTVAARLSRARERLRGRLARRGVVLPAGALTLLLPQAASSAVPPALVRAAAGLCLTSGAAVPVPVAALTEGVLHAMFLAKLKTAAVMVLAVALLAGGAGIWGYAARANPAADDSPPQAAKQEGKRTTDVADNERAERLKALLKERQDAAAKEFEHRHREFLAGRGTLDIVIGASGRLLKADLELAANKPARVAAREAHCDRLKEFHDINTARYEAGRITVADLKQTEYFYKDAEIELEREKGR
jgi:RNA polymerase sigma factor (sigma-70 family)